MKDTVQVLLSIYNPNITYLEKQLISLNNQTYTNIELLVYDDCPANRTNVKIFEDTITNFPYKILPYKRENVGYLKAFETLVKESNADYIAFCDQDDIWREDKIEKSINALKLEDALVVASDRIIIDENDNITCDSVRKHSNKNYESWQTGDDICKYNLFITYAVGMCLVARGNYAREILPFSKHTGHDKWILSCASSDGRVAFINDTLVSYRRHGNNVSGVLVGVNSKDDYVNQRIKPLLLLLEDFFARYPNHKDRKEIETFAYARKNHKLKDLIKYRKLAPDIAKFEIVISCLPNFLFSMAVRLVRKIA